MLEDDPNLQRLARLIAEAERILFITGAGVSADSGLPTYRGLGGLYNGTTAEGLPIEAALSGLMLRDDPALCWKYLAELGRACLAAEPNAAHRAIAALQRQKPGCWVLTQNIDGFHRAAGSPADRLIEIHGQLAPLFCQSCKAEALWQPTLLDGPLPPRCEHCSGVLRPSVVLFEEALPMDALKRLQEQVAQGFGLVVAVGTTASFGYILEPLLAARSRGAYTAEINPERTELADWVDLHVQGRAADVLPAVLEADERC